MPVVFTGGLPGTIYNWTNSNPSIGLPASGTGDIASFTGINLGGVTAVGTITVTPELNGCTGQPQVFEISVMSRSVVPTSATASTTAICGSGPVTLTVNGGALGSQAQWKWYSGSCGGTPVGTGETLTLNVSSSTTFYVRAEGPCNATACVNVSVTVTPQPAVTLVAAPRLKLQPGQTTTLTATVTPTSPDFTYIWMKNGVVLPGVTGTTHVVDIDGLGEYTVKVTAPAICDAVSNVVKISDSLSTRFYVYSNPNDGRFKVRYYNGTNTSQKRMLGIYDYSGKLVYLTNWTVTGPYDAMDINIMHVAHGTYVVILTDKDGKVLGKEKVMIR